MVTADTSGHLVQEIEKHLEPEILKAFKDNIGSTWEGDIAFSKLFEIWAQLKNPDTAKDEDVVDETSRPTETSLNNFTAEVELSNMSDT